MKPSIIVFTCITGGRESLRNDQTVSGAKFLAFVDQNWGPTVWTPIPAYDKFKSVRRNARIHKILAHQFIDADYSLWMDGNVALRVPARQLVDEWLDDCDIATFKHRSRNCTYAEANACAAQGLDDGAIITDQVDKYRRASLNSDVGLPETTIVLRRHTKLVEAFNNHWWSELCRYSVRDQIAFMYAARAVGLKLRFITPTKFDHPYFSMKSRAAGAEPSAVRSTKTLDDRSSSP